LPVNFSGSLNHPLALDHGFLIFVASACGCHAVGNLAGMIESLRTHDLIPDKFLGLLLDPFPPAIKAKRPPSQSQTGHPK